MRMPRERLQKIIAKAGIASRRKSEELISGGEVRVNGKIAKLGDSADLSSDMIKIGSKLIGRPPQPEYYLFNKPKAVIAMMADDPRGRKSLLDFRGRISKSVFPVGRMDFNGEGLMILTSDGSFAHRLQTQSELPRRYRVKVKGHPTAKALEKLSRAGRVGKALIHAEEIKILKKYASKTLIEFTIKGMGAVEIKKFFQNKGFDVERVVRYQIGHLKLGDLASGQFKKLRKSQATALLDQPELGWNTSK